MFPRTFYNVLAGIQQIKGKIACVRPTALRCDETKASLIASASFACSSILIYSVYAYQRMVSKRKLANSFRLYSFRNPTPMHHWPLHAVVLRVLMMSTPGYGD